VSKRDTHFGLLPPDAPGTPPAIAPPAAVCAAHFSEGASMQDKVSEFAGDPLWLLRFEPRDPVFDPDEVEEEPKHRRRKKMSRAALIAAAIAAGCGGSSAPAIHATDAILIHLEEGAAPPAGRAGPDDGPPI